MEQGRLEKRRISSAAQGFLTIGTLYSCLYCMLASSVLVSLPILGGAMYLLGRIALLFTGLWKPGREGVISASFRRIAAVLLIAFFLLALVPLTIYPIRLENGHFWRLAAIALLVAVRPALTRYIVERALVQQRKTMRILLRVCGVQALFLPPLLALLLTAGLDGGALWGLLIGFIVSGVLECFPLERMSPHPASVSEEEKREMEVMRKAHAYRMFRNMMLVIAAALQVTQVMAYAFIAVTGEAVLVCMLIALLCTYAASLLANSLLSRGPASRSDPNLLLAGGLAVWFYGLILFIRAMDSPLSVYAYLSLALCTAGSTACVRALVQMEEDMRRVACFALGHTPPTALDQVWHLQLEFSSLVGQMVALVGLTLITAFTANDFPGDWDAVFRSFSPALTLPALALVAAAILFALRFPLTRAHLEKLKRYTDLQRDGVSNAPLHDQLEAVVVQRSLKRYGIKLILLILRPLYYHRIRGQENVRLDEDIPCVFVCNHGEVYGPIVATLYVPYSFRPWVTYEMMDASAVADRTMNGVLSKAHGRLRRLYFWLIEHGVAAFAVWVMKSLDAIPVYHDQPRKLMQTFRDTITAMQAGDNILLFPENADTTADHRYAREGVSEFFTGFAMIGQMYANKTGKCPLFIPLYADKRRRTITFGRPTRYNAEINPNEEKERLCSYLRNEMLRVAALGENDKKE